MPLTDTQHAILAFIVERIDAEGLPPSQTEIAHAFGFKSVRAAQYHLEALERDGAIERLPGRARGLRVVQAPPVAQGELKLQSAQDIELLHLPVLGRVAAGTPIGADADTENAPHFVLDLSLFRPAPDYLLQVQGDSMREEGILDGDLVGVQRRQQAHHGQIVVARLDGEITIKQLDMSGPSLRLLPCNADYAPISVPDDAEFSVEGLYCGLLRLNRSLPR